MSRLESYPYLLSKTNLCSIYGVSISTLNRWIIGGWGKNLEWHEERGKLKATRSSVEAQIERGIARTCRRTDRAKGAIHGTR